MKTERTPYTTTLYIWNQVSAMFYSAYITPFHSHNAMQLIFDLGGQFRFSTHDTYWRSCKSLVIKENIVHRLDTGGSVQLIIYLDASSEIAAAIRSQYLQQGDFFSLEEDILHVVPPGTLEQCMIEPNKGLLEKIVHQILDKLKSGGFAPPHDHRVKKAMSLVAGAQADEMSIAWVSENLFMSESRLRSVFRNGAGISLHRYIILHRIILGITAIMNGASITQAAIGAGFSDSSHFHKVMFQLFGISPSQFIRDNSRKNIERTAGSLFRLETRQYDECSWTVEKVIVR